MITFDVELRAGSFRLAARGSFENGVTGLFGVSGSGKTTLLHALAGLRRIDRGTIELDGHVLADTARKIDLPPEQRRVGIVFQDGRLFPHLDVAENLRFGMSVGRPGSPALTEVIDTLELEPLLERASPSLSGGERQRVALGRSLLAAPRVLLLDEPLASIDRARRSQIIPYLRRLHERFGIPALHVTHDLPELLSMTDRLILLDRGEVGGSGDYRDLALRPEWLGPGSPLGRVNVLPALVTAIDGETARVRLGERGTGPELAAVGGGLAVGDRVTVTIGAEEIALAVGEIGPTSFQNRLQALVARRTDRGGATVVELALGGPAPVMVLVEVTTRSAERLELAEGHEVTALIKASAVRIQ